MWACVCKSVCVRVCAGGCLDRYLSPSPSLILSWRSSAVSLSLALELGFFLVAVLYSKAIFCLVPSCPATALCCSVLSRHSVPVVSISVSLSGCLCSACSCYCCQNVVHDMLLHNN